MNTNTAGQIQEIFVIMTEDARQLQSCCDGRITPDRSLVERIEASITALSVNLSVSELADIKGPLDIINESVNLIGQMLTLVDAGDGLEKLDTLLNDAGLPQKNKDASRKDFITMNRIMISCHARMIHQLIEKVIDNIMQEWFQNLSDDPNRTVDETESTEGSESATD